MKNLFLFIALLFSFNVSAQFGFTYNPADSTYTNYGGWSLKNMYVQKDSTSNSDSYFFKSYHRNIHLLNNTVKRNSPFNNRGNIIVVAGLVTPVTPTYNYGVSRPVNSTSFTPSTTQPYRVYYNVEISCTATIGSSSSGSVVLQYYNGSAWVNTPGVVKNSNTVSLAVVLNSVTIAGGTISGEFPPNTPLRLVSTSSGTTTITYNTGTEILY